METGKTRREFSITPDPNDSIVSSKSSDSTQTVLGIELPSFKIGGGDLFNEFVLNQIENQYKQYLEEVGEQVKNEVKKIENVTDFGKKLGEEIEKILSSGEFGKKFSDFDQNFEIIFKQLRELEDKLEDIIKGDYNPFESEEHGANINIEEKGAKILSKLKSAISKTIKTRKRDIQKTILSEEKTLQIIENKISDEISVIQKQIESIVKIAPYIISILYNKLLKIHIVLEYIQKIKENIEKANNISEKEKNAYINQLDIWNNNLAILYNHIKSILAIYISNLKQLPLTLINLQSSYTVFKNTLETAKITHQTGQTLDTAQKITALFDGEATRLTKEMIQQATEINEQQIGLAKRKVHNTKEIREHLEQFKESIRRTSTEMAKQQTELNRAQQQVSKTLDELKETIQNN